MFWEFPCAGQIKPNLLNGSWYQDELDVKMLLKKPEIWESA